MSAIVAQSILASTQIAAIASPKKPAAPKSLKAAKLPKTPKSPKTKAPPKPKTVGSHPTYGDMVKKAVNELKEKKGSSRAAILKYILANFKVGTNYTQINSHLRQALKRGVTNGALKQTKGTGASGSFRVGESEIKKALPKNTAAKKSPKKKPAVGKKTAADKKPAKKAVARPTLKTPTKTALVKAPATPTAAKTAATKKVATPAKKVTATTKKAAVPVKKVTVPVKKAAASAKKPSTPKKKPAAVKKTLAKK